METATMDDDSPEQPCNSTPAAPPLLSPKDTASSPPSPPTIIDGAPPTLPTTVDGAHPTSPNRMEGGTGLEETMKELSKDYTLSLGMEFESEEDAYEFYNDHARITDQDPAMAKAISIVMPDVTHGLCTFHLNQNALKHLGHLFKDDSDFGKELNTCIFGYGDEQELEEGLDRMSVMEIPESYILRRWRLDAKACASKDSKVSVEEDDPNWQKQRGDER
ncbi:hypothetical protein RHGRI_017311 [Rhododendron griersonianum]|uniref:Protein FAR1-RELATED SEQUENCE n=1 Tax=Rhododendron griersonianum TaxID=479676 RepID=A0AAV6JXA9_9ERIC|nr:hypothetical protein RHGRI_017311 [Rhododendron griersonianum]